MHDLAAFAKKEKRLYAHQRSAADRIACQTAASLAEADERARPAATAALEAKAGLAAARKAVAKVRTVERNRERAVAEEEEEKLTAGTADAKSKQRRLDAAKKRAASAATEARAAEVARANAEAQASASAAPCEEAAEKLVEARRAFDALMHADNCSSLGSGATPKGACRTSETQC